METPAEPRYYTSGFIRLTRPQFIGTLAGLMLCLLLAALDQTIVGTAEPRIISQLSGFDRYPWVSTMYLLSSTLAVPIFASPKSSNFTPDVVTRILPGFKSRCVMLFL